MPRAACTQKVALSDAHETVKQCRLWALFSPTCGRDTGLGRCECPLLACLFLTLAFYHIIRVHVCKVMYCGFVPLTGCVDVSLCLSPKASSYRLDLDHVTGSRCQCDMR